MPSFSVQFITRIHEQNYNKNSSCLVQIDDRIQTLHFGRSSIDSSVAGVGTREFKNSRCFFIVFLQHRKRRLLIVFEGNLCCFKKSSNDFSDREKKRL